VDEGWARGIGWPTFLVLLAALGLHRCEAHRVGLPGHGLRRLDRCAVMTIDVRWADVGRHPSLASSVGLPCPSSNEASSQAGGPLPSGL